MRHDAIEAGHLRGPERRIIGLLRAWAVGPPAQAAAWQELCALLGPARASDCLNGFEAMHALLHKHGWRGLTILAVGAEGWSEDELAVARFVLAATEQQREVALAEAGFLVSPAALLPLLAAATRCGLPLLCAECRARILGQI